MVQLVYQQHYSVISCAFCVMVNLLYLDEMFMAAEVFSLVVQACETNLFDLTSD